MYVFCFDLLSNLINVVFSTPWCLAHHSVPLTLAEETDIMTNGPYLVHNHLIRVNPLASSCCIMWVGDAWSLIEFSIWRRDGDISKGTVIGNEYLFWLECKIMWILNGSQLWLKLLCIFSAIGVTKINWFKM